jgi:hypothetical protein
MEPNGTRHNNIGPTAVRPNAIDQSGIGHAAIHRTNDASILCGVSWRAVSSESSSKKSEAGTRVLEPNASRCSALRGSASESDTAGRRRVLSSDNRTNHWQIGSGTFR